MQQTGPEQLADQNSKKKKRVGPQQECTMGPKTSQPKENKRQIHSARQKYE